MGLAAVLASIAGYVLALARFTAWPAATLPAFVMSTLVLVLYLAGLAGMLKAGAWIVMGGGLAALATVFITPRPGAAAARRTFTDPGIVVFLVCALLFWIRMRNAAYHNFDEFSHWGVVVKEMVRLDGLPVAASPLKFLSYPPGSALFQYYVACFAGYSEGLTIFAQALLTLSMVAVLLQRLDWSRAVAVSATTVTAVLLVFVLGNGLKNILIDHLVSVYFGGAVAMVLLAREREPAAAARALPLLMVLPLLKAVGLFLALVAAAAIAIIVLAQWRAMPSARLKLSAALLCAAAFIGPHLAAKSWTIHVRESGFPQTFAPQLSPMQLARTLAGNERTPRDDAIVSSFARAWTTHTVQKSGWTSTTWVLVLLAAFAVAAWRAPAAQARGRVVVIGVVMVVGCALYGAGLLMLYLRSFSEYEATRSLQFGRYLSIYLLGWAWIALALLRGTGAQAPRVRAAAYALGAFVLGALIAMAPIPNLQESRPVERAEIHERAAEIAKRIPADKSVYVLWEHSKGMHYWVLRYELLPRRTNQDCWSIGAGFDETDVWTCPLPSAEIGRRLAAFDYVLVAKGNDALSHALRPFLEGASLEDWTVLSVEKPAEGRVVLRR